MAEPMMNPAADPVWKPWRVAPQSGFEVDDPRGDVGFVQINRQEFAVTRTFRFSDAAIERDLVARVARSGVSEAEARRAVDDARTFEPSDENPTDLASIPRFMRWFEVSYGHHTLAAIIHDELIRDTANSGALRSDALADRFFRQMMRCAGVPWLKRWIMWAAVALRSRWAAGGGRRLMIGLWVLLAVAGITAFVAAAGTVWPNWDPPIDTGVLLAFAVVVPFPAAALWGQQYGGGLVAAIAALWILPAAILAGLGYVVYLALERIFHALGVD